MEKPMMDIPTRQAGFHDWRGREIAIEAETLQPVWTDGEHTGMTPITMSVMPGALQVVVP